MRTTVRRRFLSVAVTVLLATGMAGVAFPFVAGLNPGVSVPYQVENVVMLNNDTIRLIERR